MASTIGKLSIILTAKTSTFTQGIDRAQRGITGMRKSVTRMTGALTTMSSALTGLAVGGGLSAIVGKSLSAADKLGKTAEKLGIASEKLAGLRLAADRTGVSVEKLDMGLQRMVRRVSEAAHGSGEAQAALKELGLDAKALNRLTPDQQFRRIAEAMRGVQNPADRLRLSFKLFDSEGADLVRTLALGAAGLDAAQQEAVKLGLALTRIDTTKAAEALDAMARIRDAVAGLGNKVAMQAAPAIAVLADEITDMLTRTSDAGDKASESLGVIGTAIAAILETIKGVKIAIAGIEAAFAKTTSFIVGGIAKLAEKLPDSITLFSPQNVLDLKQLKTKLAVAATVTDVNSDIKSDKLEELLMAPSAAERIRERAEEIRKSIEAVGDAATDTGDAAASAADKAASAADHAASAAKRAAVDAADAYDDLQRKVGEVEEPKLEGEFRQVRLNRIALEGPPGVQMAANQKTDSKKQVSLLQDLKVKLYELADLTRNPPPTKLEAY